MHCFFPDLPARYKAVRALQADITKFCAAYRLDAFRRAEELFTSFSTTFSKFNCSLGRETDKAEDLGSSDGEDDDTDEEYGGAKVYDEKRRPFPIILL